MLCFILFPTLILAVGGVVIDLEQHVSLARNKLPQWCGVVIFSKGIAEFAPFKRPVEIHQTLSPTFELTRVCNIIAVHLHCQQGNFSIYEAFVIRHFFQIPLVIIYLDSGFLLKDENLNSLPGRGIWRKEVILVSNDGLVLRLGTECYFENPVCFLRGVSIKVGYNHMPPFIYVKNWTNYADKKERYPDFYINPSMNDTELDVINGFEGQLLRHLSVEYLMKFVMKAPKDMQYGSHQNGAWSGKFFQLQMKEVHMIIGIIPGNSERAEIGDYLAPLCDIIFAMVTKQNEHEMGWKAPFLAIPPFLWASLFVSTFFVGVLAYRSHNIHLNILRDSTFKRIQWDIRAQRCLASCGKLMQILLKQPIFNNHKGPTLFIVTGWMIFSLIIGSIYNSNLTARLSVQDPSNSIDTMKDVWEQQKILKMGSGNTMDVYMRTSKERYTVLVREHLMQYVNSTWRKPFVEYFYNPLFVGTAEYQQFIYKVLTGTDGIGRKNLSEFHISLPMIKIFGSWMTRHNFVLRPAINTAMLRASEMGLVVKWMNDPIVLDDGSLINMNKDFLKWHFEDSDGHIKEKKPFTMKQFRGIFILLAVGLSCSLVCFVFELVMGRLKSSLPPRPPPRILFEYVE